MRQQKPECQNCGTLLKFESGNFNSVCVNCGTKNEIIQANERIGENDSDLFKIKDKIELPFKKCNTCKAEISYKTDINFCPFCVAKIPDEDRKTKKIPRPKQILPFKVKKKQAREEFQKWVNSLWIFPEMKKNLLKDDPIIGIYLPFWSYKCHTENDYEGKRGNNYYSENESAKQVLNTNWSLVSGKLSKDFEDILIKASDSLSEKYYDFLEPWDLNKLDPYKDNTLNDFITEIYNIEPEKGFEQAKNIMYDDICISIRNEISGDHQQITSINTEYFKISVKYILLPVWISSFQKKNKIFRFMINARTGEVYKEKPDNDLKRILMVIPVLIIITLIIILSYFI